MRDTIRSNTLNCKTRLLKSVLLTQNKESKRSSFPKRQWPVNKPNYEWHSCLQAEHQSLADFWVNGLFSPTNAMALKVICGNNHWHKLSWELWPGFPWRKMPQTEVRPGSTRTNRTVHCMALYNLTGWLCFCSWAHTVDLQFWFSRSEPEPSTFKGS